MSEEDNNKFDEEEEDKFGDEDEDAKLYLTLRTPQT
jgi:hypothetical protein